MRFNLYFWLAILMLIPIGFILYTFILTFTTNIVEAGARTGVIIFFVLSEPALIYGDVLLFREWRARIKPKV
jgi:hypothetical protein